MTSAVCAFDVIPPDEAFVVSPPTGGFNDKMIFVVDLKAYAQTNNIDQIGNTLHFSVSMLKFKFWNCSLCLIHFHRSVFVHQKG